MNDLQQYLSIVANEIQGYGGYNSIIASKARKAIDLRLLTADELHKMVGTTPPQKGNKKAVTYYRKDNRPPKATANDVPKVNKVDIKTEPKPKTKKKKQNKPKNTQKVAQQEVYHHNAQPNPKFTVADGQRKLFDGSTKFPRSPVQETPAAKDGMFKRAGKFLAKHKGKAALGAAGTGALGYIGYRSYRNGRDS